MASNSSSHVTVGPTKRTSLSGFPGGNASILLDRSKAGIRGSTPDSEALASSDDEQDQFHRLHPATNNPVPKPTRRASWLTEAQKPSNRKSSFGGAVPFSPASPGVGMSPSDQTPWGTSVVSSTGSTMGRGYSNSTSIPWGNTIWNSESQKAPPPRLTEVLTSPTTMIPPASTGIYSEEPPYSPVQGRENMVDPAIPFAIPLQPTLKTYRSQSYSVGQLDPETTNQPSNSFGMHNLYGRPRNGPSHSGLQHRPSRPSMLGDSSHDPSLLGQLREVEDDEESSTGSVSGVQLAATQARIEELAMENALLRQQAADQLESTRVRHRAASSSSVNNTTAASVQTMHQRIRESVPEESDYALYEVDDPDTQRFYRYGGLNGRRSSEYGTKSVTQYTFAGAPENRTLENVKKGHWQSSLGFGGIGEPPQSRRHSFADVPTRQNSIGSNGDAQTSQTTMDVNARSNGRHGSPGGGGYCDGLGRPSQGDDGEYAQFHYSPQSFQEQKLELQHLRDRAFAVNYFSRTEPSLRNGEGRGPLSSGSLHQQYMQSQYGRPQHLGHHQPRPNQLLYVVTFKCQRADVFYVQEGTGLQVRKGDLVIVEADRGTDLGTVASENLPWAEAKEQKERFIEEQHSLLMMWSHHNQNGTIAGPNPNGQPSPHPGASPGHLGSHEFPGGDLKPKMIKRLAQPHETSILREKEGNEAKAKRVCQQKVVEHRLNMEILDAEFQMDWKKLTFFYFADSYINFNPLVTDLFKIYKTRIWMSAINTAAIGTPSTGLQQSNNLGANTFGADLDQPSTRRQQRHHPHSASTGSSSTVATSYDPIWSQAQGSGTMGPMTFPQLYAQPFPAQGLDVRPLGQYPMDYRQLEQQALAMQSTFSPASYDAPSLHASSFTSPVDNNNGGARERQPRERDWNHAFQGLSLGQ